MKRLFLCLMIGLAVSSCKFEDLLYRIDSERYLKACLVAPSTYKRIGFSRIDDVTIKEEIDNRLGYCQRMVEFYEGQAKGYFATDDDKKKLQREKEMLAAVEGLYDLYEGKLDSVARLEYRIVYEASNQYGVPVRGTFDTRFDPNTGQIVGARMGEDSWTILGDFFSIPEYYDILDKFK